MITIDSNIANVKKDLGRIPSRILGEAEDFFKDNEDEMYADGRRLMEQVVYMSFPEGNYVRRGTSTGNLGILNSIITSLSKDGSGVALGISSGSSAIADTIPLTAKGRAMADTYAAFMITGGGFLEPLGTDVRDFLEVWVRFFELTLPYKYLRDAVIPAVRGIV